MPITNAMWVSCQNFMGELSWDLLSV
jgi:hypothetical protein